MLAPFFQQFSKQSIKAQYEANIKQLSIMLAKAKTTGRKVNGNTEDQLSGMLSSISKSYASL